ncbi:MAG: CDP-alcohol phosphatidyltransferase family protein [Methanophagales archaeon]|nr:CDP-alcohol phosphatidyltransferase family protein [Methanophagales archaeon]
MDIRTDSPSILRLIKLPDLLSVLNALLGFSAILLVLGGVSVTERALKNALVLILLAAVVDGLDGMVARTIECSPLGVYLDSLADMLSFGVAPAIVVYVLITDYSAVSAPHGDVVLALCGAYVISGMLRLARFNANLFLERKALPKEETNSSFSTGSLVEKERVTNTDFIGFPITGAATFLASFVLLAIELEVPPYSSASLLIALMGILCFLMTSRIRYRSIRDKRLVLPVGIVFLTFFFFSILALQFIYLALAVVAVTTVYMCSPLLYLDKRT